MREWRTHVARLDADGVPRPAPGIASPCGRGGDPARELPACTACHGAAMTGVRPAVPGLLGLPRDYLIGQLGGWQTGLRQATAPDCMAAIAKRLSGDDVSAVASWLAAQPLPADPHPAPATTQHQPLRCGSAGSPR